MRTNWPRAGWIEFRPEPDALRAFQVCAAMHTLAANQLLHPVMKKLLLLSLLVALGAATVRADKDPRAEYVTRVETCEAILREFMAKPETAIPAAVLAQAHAPRFVGQ